MFLKKCMKQSLTISKRGFTLIELLIVIGIVAILATITLLVLNPVETLKKSRDTRRISEVGSIHAALSLVQTQNSAIFLGLPQTVYISLPDTNLNCSSHNLPALPSGWNYACKSESDYRKNNGSGWIPVDFESLPVKTLSSLPVDPVNTNLNGAGFYYAYFSGSWEITTKLESATYNAGGNSDLVSSDGGKTDLLYEVGTELFLSPAEIYDRSLVGVGAPADSVVPTVSITAPTGGSVSGTITISATASDNVGIAGVQFRINGVNLGSEDTTTSSFSASWDTTPFSNNNHTITAVARDTSNNLATSVGISVTVNNVTADTTPPTFSGVNASSISQIGATITWTTDEVGDSQVYYGTTIGYGSQTSLNGSMVTNHSQVLSGLTADTTYHYQVRSEDGSGNQGASGDFTFMTQASGVGTCEATGGANCYYIDVNGSDTNPGTFALPYKTFRPAIVAAVPGDIIYARGGTYNYDNSMLESEGRRTYISIQNVTGQYTVNNGAAGNPITVRNYPGENPILDMNDARFNLTTGYRPAVTIREKSFWTLDGFEIVNGHVSLNAYPSGATVNAGLTHDIIIRNNHIHHLTMESSENHGMIFINRGDDGGAYNISILNNQLHDFYDAAYPGQWMNTGLGGIHLGALTTLSCQSYVNFECGGTGSITFSGNTVYHVPQAFYFKNPAPGPIMISDNIIHDVESLGTMITANVTMNHNLVYNVDQGWAYVGRDGLSDPRIYTVSGQNAVVTNNTFVGLDLLFNIVNGTNHTVSNNIFFGMADRAPGAGYDTNAYIKKSATYPDPTNVANSLLQDITSNNNCFITPYSDFQMVQRYVPGNIEHYTREQANTTFGYDSSSVFITQSNPASIFVNPASNNYNLINPATCPGMGYYAY
jgi:prepilin-type N-terminal cleavage/methylation domain-containing protein